MLDVIVNLLDPTTVGSLGVKITLFYKSTRTPAQRQLLHALLLQRRRRLANPQRC